LRVAKKKKKRKGNRPNTRKREEMKKKRSKLTNKSNDEPWKWNSEEMMDKKKT